MLSTALGFPLSMINGSISAMEAAGFSLSFGVIMNLKRFDVLFDNKLSIIRLYSFLLFACFLLKSKADQYE